MTKEECSAEILSAVRQLEDYTKQLATTLEVLKRTAGQDANIVAIRECKNLLDELPDANVKQTVQSVRKALVTRTKHLLNELSK